MIRAPLAAVAEAFDSYPAMRVRSAVTPLVFPLQRDRPLDGDPPMLLWQPRNSPGLTVFMPEGASNFVAAFAETTFRIELVNLRSTADTVHWAVNELDFHADGARQRFVRVMREDHGWNFCQQGEPLPFELTVNYGERIKRKRLKREHVWACVEAWGAPIRESDFWRTDVPALTFVAKGPPIPPRHRPTGGAVECQ